MKLTLLLLLVSAAAAFTSAPRSRFDASIASLKMSSIGTTYPPDHHFDARDYYRQNVYQEQQQQQHPPKHHFDPYAAWNGREVHQHEYSPGHRGDGSWNHDFEQRRYWPEDRRKRKVHPDGPHRQRYSAQQDSHHSHRQRCSVQDWMGQRRRDAPFSKKFNPHHLVDDYHRWSNHNFDPEPDSPHEYYMGFNPQWQDHNYHGGSTNERQSSSRYSPPPPPPADLHQRDQQRDLYQILGVSPRASFNEIKQAYHKLTKLYHPGELLLLFCAFLCYESWLASN